MTKQNKRDDAGKVGRGNFLALRHGGYTLLKSGRVPSVRGRRRIAKQLNEFRAALMAAVPGSDDPRKAALVGQIVRAEGFALLVEAFLRRYGLVKLSKGGALETMPALREVIMLMNTQRAAIAALGLDRKEVEALKAPYELVDEEPGE